MTDEQMALRLMQELQDMTLTSAIYVLEGAISNVRATERARCAAIIADYIDSQQPHDVLEVALRIRDAIIKG